MSIRCGNRAVHGTDMAHHETVAQVKLCFRTGGLLSLEERDEQQVINEIAAAERGYERFLETNDQYREEDERDRYAAEFGLPL
jgi:hypothetical protein